jgi:hypothetical protein
VLEQLTAMAAKLDARPPNPYEPGDPELDQFMVRPDDFQHPPLLRNSVSLVDSMSQWPSMDV